MNILTQYIMPKYTLLDFLSFTMYNSYQVQSICIGLRLYIFEMFHLRSIKRSRE